MSNTYLDIAMQKVIRQEVNKELEDIKAEIERMKDIPEQGTWRAACDEAIAAIDKHISGKETVNGSN